MDVDHQVTRLEITEAVREVFETPGQVEMGLFGDGLAGSRTRAPLGGGGKTSRRPRRPAPQDSHAHEQVTRGRGGAGDIGPPKSATARRAISIPTEPADELSRHMQSMGLTGADPDELLFPNQDGRPLDYSNWRGRVWEPAVKAVGMARLNFNNLRRTNATAMVAEGVDVKTAQAKLGHSDPRLTRDWVQWAEVTSSDG